MKKLLIKNRFLLLTIAVASLLCFWKLGSWQLSPWDEARQGQNARWSKKVYLLASLQDIFLYLNWMQIPAELIHPGETRPGKAIIILPRSYSYEAGTVIDSNEELLILRQ